MSDEEVNALNWEEKCKILRSNPVTAARHFQYRLDLFPKHVILGKAKPIGSVVHFFYRIEFQQRGSPHAHGVVWIKDAPDPETDSPQTIAAFVDRYVSCELPSVALDPELHSLVNQLQRHTHTASCKKKGNHCRFNFPRPISSETVVSSTSPSESTNEVPTLIKDTAKETLCAIKTYLQETDGVENLTYEEVLRGCKIAKGVYQQSLKVSSDNTTVFLKRSPSAININNYNKWMLLGWQANMDIQFVSNPYACIDYIIKYITKEERDMGTLLEAVGKETADAGIREQMKKCGQAFLNARSVSAQEGDYRLLGLPLYKSNFDSIWIPTGLPKERVSL